MHTKLPQPTQDEYFRRRQTLEDGFASGIFVCFQSDIERLKRLQEHRLVMPVPTSDRELFAQELAWKEIEIDLAVAAKEAFKRAYSDEPLPKGLTQQWAISTAPRPSKSKIEEVRPQVADIGMLEPDTTIQVLYDSEIYNPKLSLETSRQWQTVDFLWLSKDLQKEASARFEKFLRAQPSSRRITYGQETYLRHAIEPRVVLQLWDHAVLVMHHWLKAWIFIYRQTKDIGNLMAATRLYDDFVEREPIEEWHMGFMEKCWAQGMVGSEPLSSGDV